VARGEALGYGSEDGLLGLAFHPNFSQNHYFYLFYSALKNGALYERVSRFSTMPGNTSVADPSSEVILISQLDRAANHNGGDLHFGPDGYLYVSVGDEGSEYNQLGNAQHIDLNFFSGILRIDVDKKPGNVEPNPHAAVPVDANGKAYYSVPIDNPFVLTDNGGTWDGSGYFANRNANFTLRDPNFDYTKIRTEFWAFGMRNPWRFSIDPANGNVWVGDVGQDRFEEVDLVTKGANYGWAFYEGNHNTKTDTQIKGSFQSMPAVSPIPPLNPPPFTPPVYEYTHTSGPLGGYAIIGGLVYHGTNLPQLTGTYIFGDYGGNMWSLSNTTGIYTALPISTNSGLGFGADPSNGDILAAEGTYVGRLVAGGSFASNLSMTGIFTNMTAQTLAPGFVSYTINAPAWNDGTQSTYAFYVPGANSTMTWAQDQPWTFPTGTIWVQNIDVNNTVGDPTTRRHVETRVLVKTATGISGASYYWNNAQADAALISSAGATGALNLTNNGTAIQQTWHLPSQAECATCHNAAAGYALSFNTRQLNRTGSMNGFAGNELDLLHQYGYLANDPGPAAALPAFPDPNDATIQMEVRVRAYLAVNCAECHQPGGGGGNGTLDLRAQLTTPQTGLVNGLVANNTNGDPANRYIVPDDPAHSVVLEQMSASDGFARMPPITSNVLDAAGLALIEDWIDQSAPLAGPGIVSQPANLTLATGETASFSARATGDDPLAYQWQKNGAAIDGATNATLVLGNVTLADSGNYSVVVSNSVGNATSNVATLAVLIPPSISLQPKGTAVILGHAASFTVSANGTAPLSYQWSNDAGNLSGASNASLAFSNVTADEAGNYSVTVSNAVGQATSHGVRLIVLFPPLLVAQPASTYALIGKSANLTVAVTGTGPFSYQWYFKGKKIAGATQAVLALKKASAANTGAYYVTVTGPGGTVTSVTFNLAVVRTALVPSVTRQPLAVTVKHGGTARFTVGATGTLPLAYQWQFFSGNLTNTTTTRGANTATLTLIRVTNLSAGPYRVIITNPIGQTVSGTAILTVK
jgi:glucose/arabinose dehydrogenase/mono/diheme cytochrome c family protein